MARGTIPEVIKWAFTKWFARMKGTFNIPDNFANIARNVRIKGGVYPRPWYSNIHYTDSMTPVRGIKANNIQNAVYFCQNSNFQSVNLTTGAIATIGAIATDNRCRFIEYGKYTIILTGANKPRFYDGITLTQTTATIAASVNPQFGAKFAWFTAINSQLNTNVIYFSRPVTLANQERCYDRVWSGAETMSFDTPVWGMLGTLNNLWIWTKNTIEYIGKDNITTTGGIASLFSIPLGTGSELASPDAVCAADDIIFFLTKSRKIKSIGYFQWNINPQISDISDMADVGIDDYMKNDLDEDQSSSFAFYDRVNSYAIFSVKSKWASTNDRYVIWDFVNKTFVEDTEKRFSCITNLGDDYYAGSAFGLRIVKEFTGTTDISNAVKRTYETINMSSKNPTSQKQYRGSSISGMANNATSIKREAIVEGRNVLTRTIDLTNSSQQLGIASYPVATEPIGNQLGDLSNIVSFSEVVDQGNLRATGRTIKMRFSGGDIGQNFIIDYLDITLLPRQHKYDKSYKV